MNIAFVVEQFPALSETFILNQVTGLVDLGHDVQVFACTDPADGQAHPDVGKYDLAKRTHYFSAPSSKAMRLVQALSIVVQSRNVPAGKAVRSLNVFKYGREAVSLRLFYALAAVLRSSCPFDILHCHFGPNGNLGARLRRLGIGRKLVTTFHGYDTRLGIEKGSYIYRDVLEVGDCFLAPTNYNYDSLLQFGAPPRKVVRHPNGIDVHQFRYRKPREPQGKGETRLISVARLSEEKGIHFAVRAVRHLLDRRPELALRYDIVGGGHAAARLLELVTDLGLEAVVHFLGPGTQEQVIESLARSDVFVLPSIEESFGVALLEAQAVGLPVIATRVGGTWEAIAEGRSGYLVPPCDPSALAECIQFLADHPGSWTEMGACGRSFVEQNYDVKILNQRLEEIYQRLLSNKPLPEAT
jgi:colanic acid/amylovoran biosynthesis glycosyltransferase